MNSDDHTSPAAPPAERSGPPGRGPDPPAPGGVPDPDAGAEDTAKPAKAPPKKKKSKALRGLLQLLLKLAIAAVAVWILLTFVGGIFIVHTSDMYPALRDGDLVITYRLGEYHSGDIVACRVNGQTCFGRIVGEPTDEIFIGQSGEYTVNGLRPYETVFYDTVVRESDTMTYPYVIREGEFFLLADARETGLDSRDYGPVTEIMGKVVLALRRRGF